MNKKTINLFLAGAFFVGLSTPKLAFFWDKKEKKVPVGIENNLQIENPDLGVQQNIKEKVKNFTGKRAAIGTGEVVAIGDETLTIVKDEKTYTVITDSKTKFRRKFWGTSSLNEISINDLVSVVGRWQNEERTQIKAMIVRNISVQKRYGVFFGVVTSVTDSGFVIQSAQRGDQTVSVLDTTKIVDRVMSVISLSDIEVGHRVRVKGTWDNVNSTISDIVQIKDFSIPVLPSPTSTTN
ncbi:hypothetical protein KJ570_02745 [Patescibacteria group bacterium]|nr:hypothetical protein [Patescibacteria group bacterium]